MMGKIASGSASAPTGLLGFSFGVMDHLGMMILRKIGQVD